MKINRLEIENVKRVKAVRLEPTENGLTVIGGRNGQGKTSVLDAIAWALGGDSYRPQQAQRNGSVVPPYLRVVMDNGLVVERKGKNSELKVTDPNGGKGGQQLLNEFVERLALDLPRFMQTTTKEKTQTLLKVIGVGDRLAELELEESRLYEQRHTIGQIADRKRKYADEQAYYPDAPGVPVSASELIQKQQHILAVNGENQRKRGELKRLGELKEQLEREQVALTVRYTAACAEYETALKSAEQLRDESTAELEKNIEQVEEINRKVRVNLDKEKAEEDAKAYQKQYDELTVQLESARAKKQALLDGAKLPLAGLTVTDGELTYNGYKWDSMSGSEQLKAAVAIVRSINPKCGFVLMDKLEQMDGDTLAEFGRWLESEGLQAIATRVSTGGECSIVIEDGRADSETDEPKRWKEGTF